LDGLEDELALIDGVEQEKAPVIPSKSQQQQVQSQANTTNPDSVFNFPSAPQGKIQQVVKETEDERALRELQESMLA
jgi:hypothetical protein